MKPTLTYKQLLAFFLITGLFVQTFGNCFVFVDYYLNTKSYAKNCENKARPKMHCNGQCQMMKKLREQEQKEQQQPVRKINYKQVLALSSKSFFATVNDIALIEIISKPNSGISNGSLTTYCFDIFHPPRI